MPKLMLHCRKSKYDHVAFDLDLENKVVWVEVVEDDLVNQVMLTNKDILHLIHQLNEYREELSA